MLVNKIFGIQYVGKNETLLSLDFCVIFGWFSSCPLKVNSLSPSWHPSLPIHACLPKNFVLDPFLMLCVYSLIHSCNFKSFIWYLVQTFIFNFYHFSATYIHLPEEYLLNAPPTQPMLEAWIHLPYTFVPSLSTQ